MLSMTDRHQATAYPLRLPPELKKRVEESAAAQGRSLNAEIIARLQSSFDSPTESLSEVGEKIEALKGQIENLTTRSAVMLLEAVKNEELVMVDGEWKAGPNFQLGTKLEVKPPRKRRVYDKRKKT